MDGECWREKKKNKEQKERETYYQRNGYTSEEVERRAKGRQKKERIKESRYNREYERCTWGERVQKKEN
jgi:hypothetical protein